MTDEDQLAKDAKRRARLRSRRMSILTLIVAAFYFCGADIALNGGGRYRLERDGIRYTNSTRLFLVTLFPLPAGPQSQPVGFGRFIQTGPNPRPGSASGPTPEQREAYARNLREISAVECAAYVWERVMWALCALMAGVALLSWITPWGRAFHLLAALAIIAVTFFSLACLHYLEIPDGCGRSLWPLSPETYATLTQKWNVPEGGGMSPPLPPRTYLALAAVLSTYGWVIIAVFARRCRPILLTEED